MPGQNQTSFFGKTQAADMRQSHKENKGKAPAVGNVGLPAGIDNGSARLVMAKFDYYKDGNDKGKPYFMASGIVFEPKTFRGQTIAGGRTQIGPEPMFATPNRSRKTFREHYDWVINQIKLLADPGQAPDGWCSVYDAMPSETDAQCAAIESFIIQTLKDLVSVKDANGQTGVCFHFRTWKGKKAVIRPKDGKFFAVELNEDGSETAKVKGPYQTEAAAKTANPFATGEEPRVNHDWSGSFSAESAPEILPDVDETPENSPGGGVGDEIPTEAAGAGEPPSDTGAVASESAGGEGPDIEALRKLAKTADADPELKTKAGNAAAIELNKAAAAAGIDDATLAGVANWAAAVDLIVAGAQGAVEETVAADETAVESEDDVAVEEPAEPVQGGTALYKKKGAKEPTAYEIASVNQSARTVTLKFKDGKNAGKKVGGADGKALHVGWDELQLA